MNAVLSAIHPHILATSVQLALHVEAHVHEARSSLYLPVDLSHAWACRADIPRRAASEKVAWKVSRETKFLHSSFISQIAPSELLCIILATLLDDEVVCLQ